MTIDYVPNWLYFDRGPAMMSCPGALLDSRRPWVLPVCRTAPPSQHYNPFCSGTPASIFRKRSIINSHAKTTKQPCQFPRSRKADPTSNAKNVCWWFINYRLLSAKLQIPYISLGWKKRRQLVSIDYAATLRWQGLLNEVSWSEKCDLSTRYSQWRIYPMEYWMLWMYPRVAWTLGALK